MTFPVRSGRAARRSPLQESLLKFAMPFPLIRPFPLVRTKNLMNANSDFSSDIDELFDHMINNLDHDLSEEMDWVFSLRSDDLAKLTRIGEQLSEDFMVGLQDELEEIDIDGSRSIGDPMLSVVRQAALTPDEVKTVSSQMAQLAAKEDLVYEGVDCFDPVDDEELIGWLSPDDATWRLRHFTDSGLEIDAELPWAFLVLTDTIEQASAIADELAEGGISETEIYDEPDDDGNYGLSAFMSGKNNEFELGQMNDKIKSIAEKQSGRMDGIQFFTREEFYEIYGEDESE